MTTFHKSHTKVIFVHLTDSVIRFFFFLYLSLVNVSVLHLYESTHCGRTYKIARTKFTQNKFTRNVSKRGKSMNNTRADKNRFCVVSAAREEILVGHIYTFNFVQKTHIKRTSLLFNGQM